MVIEKLKIIRGRDNWVGLGVWVNTSFGALFCGLKGPYLSFAPLESAFLAFEVSPGVGPGPGPGSGFWQTNPTPSQCLGNL